MRYVVTTLVLALQLAAAYALPYKPIKYCKPTQGPDFCGQSSGYSCLHWHPDKEFCEDETAPFPSCCRAAEKGSGYTQCACCASVHGSKRIDVSKRGTYQHNNPAYQDEVEYRIK